MYGCCAISYIWGRIAVTVVILHYGDKDDASHYVVSSVHEDTDMCFKMPLEPHKDEIGWLNFGPAFVLLVSLPWVVFAAQSKAVLTDRVWESRGLGLAGGSVY